MNEEAKYKTYIIKPKKDFGTHGFLINGKRVREGFVVTDKRNINVMPGAIWFQTVKDAERGIVILIKYGEKNFWKGWKNQKENEIMDAIKISQEELKKRGIKLLSKEELMNVSPGDYIECDTLHQSLLHAGYDVTYKNIHSDANGFLAHFFLKGDYIGAVDSQDGMHMIREWVGVK